MMPMSPEDTGPFPMDGIAGNEDERAVINFSKLPEEEVNLNEVQVIPRVPVPQDLPVPDSINPPEPDSTDSGSGADSAGTDLLTSPVEDAIEKISAARGLTQAPILDDSFPAAD